MRCSCKSPKCRIPLDRAIERQKMFVFVTVIVVNMRRDDALAHRIETGRHTLFDVRVTDVEAQLQIMEMRVCDEMMQRTWRTKLVGRIFQRDGHTARFCEHGQIFEGCERGVKLA